MDGEAIQPEDGKLTFSVRRFLSHKEAAEGVDLQSILDAVETAPETMDRPIRGMAWSGLDDGNWDIRFLVPKQDAGISPLDGITVTGAGYVDGMLHIQVYFEDIRETDNHGFVYLVDADGNWVETDRSISCWDDDERGSYEDYIIDVTPEELLNCKLFGDFYTGGMLTRGNWQVTFPLDAD